MVENLSVSFHVPIMIGLCKTVGLGFCACDFSTFRIGCGGCAASGGPFPIIRLFTELNPRISRNLGPSPVPLLSPKN